MPISGEQYFAPKVLSTCYSEEVAQVFVECGCRHVVYTREKVHDVSARRFAQQFWYELAMAGSLMTSWEASRQALLLDPDTRVSSEADCFMLYGQVGSDRASLDTLCGTEGGTRGGLGSHFADVSAYMDMQLPTRTENFVGREPLIHAICRTLHGPNPRRAVVLHGPAGIGKSAVALEFVHFATAPGRLFSCAPLILRLTSLGGLEEAIAGMEEQVEGLARRLGVLLRPASANSRMSDLDSSRSDSGGGTVFSELMEASDLLSTQVLARSRIRRGLQQIERRQPAAKVLCIVDDAAGAVVGSANMRWLFGDRRWNRNPRPQPEKFSKLVSLIELTYLILHVSKLIILGSCWGWGWGSDFIG